MPERNVARDRSARGAQRRRRSRAPLVAGVAGVSIAAMLAAVAVAVAVTGSVAVDRGPAAEREALARAAVGLVALPYDAFARAAAARPAPFDWSTNGCSRTPAWLARRFAGPCRQHDFAYRNLGRGLRLRADEATRRWVDGRFLTELRGRCADLFAGLRLRGCRTTARAMWVAVRRLGPHWSGGPLATAAGRDARRCLVLTAAKAT